MFGQFASLLGGVGLFLFGMFTMTEALRTLAGRPLRRLLSQFTATPLNGVATGALTTAAIQSSSATLVMTIGFVGAGLLTLGQTVGIIMGANLGTTVTGWLVLFLGVKLQLGVVALPVLFGATLVAMLTSGNLARGGRVLAGLSLLFVGLGVMQSATTDLQEILTPDSFPGEDLVGRLQLLALGVVITLVTQSSSAGVATVLIFLGAGSLSYVQAAAMVIGMHIGTSFTAVLASVGGAPVMRQTGLANVFYMMGTGALAFAALGVAMPVLRSEPFAGHEQLALVVFHTGFNLLARLVALPLTHRFARLIALLIPAGGAPMTEVLDDRLLRDPGAAIDSACAAAHAITKELFGQIAQALRRDGAPDALVATRAQVTLALEQLEDYLARISIPADHASDIARHSAILHQADHLQRLAQRATQTERIETARRDRRLRRYAVVLGALLDRHRTGDGGGDVARRLLRLFERLEWREDRLRRDAMTDAHGRRVLPEAVFRLTDSIRWLRRSAAHAERIVHYREYVVPVPDDASR